MIENNMDIIVFSLYINNADEIILKKVKKSIKIPIVKYSVM